MTVPALYFSVYPSVAPLALTTVTYMWLDDSVAVRAVWRALHREDDRTLIDFEFQFICKNGDAYENASSYGKNYYDELRLILPPDAHRHNSLLRVVTILNIAENGGVCQQKNRRF